MLRTVWDFDSFDTDNDPYREHDFGRFTSQGATLNWKTDHYDRALELGSEDPARTSAVEQAALSALQRKLLTPDRAKLFTEEFRREVERLHPHARTG